MKIWVDDIRTPPSTEWLWLKSVNEVVTHIDNTQDIELISLDHDSGDYQKDGGDYIKILDYLEFISRNVRIHLHTANPVGRENMRRIIRKNNWTEILEI